MRKITIADSTLKEAEKSADTRLSFKEKIEVARHLDNLHADVIEFPAIENGNADTLLIRTVSSVMKNSILSVSAGLTEDSAEAAWQSVSAAARPRLQISVPVSPVQMEYQCHLKGPKILELVSVMISKCAALCGDVELCCMDATRAEPEFLASVLTAAIAAGAKTVTVCDDDGSMLPDRFAALLVGLYSVVPELKNVTLGISCSNRYHMAVASTMLGVGAGAGEIKTSAGSEDAPSLETVGRMIRDCGDRSEIRAELKYTELLRTAKQIGWILHTKKSDNSPFDNGVVPEEQHGEISLTANDDISAVTRAVQKLGYDLSEEDNARVFESFGRVAEKKTVTGRELDVIVASTALQVPPTYKLVSYVVNSGNVITASAHVKLEKNGKELEGICLGDGPIDAVFLAIEQIIGHHYELDDFQIQAVTEGREAMGSALVKLRVDGRAYPGKGISTDIIGASILAYISALNKITYEEA